MKLNIFSPLRLNITKVERLRSRDEIIVKKCENKGVLHIGCADWPITNVRIKENNLLHKKIADVTSSCVGVDISEEGLAALKKNGFSHVRYGDAERLEENFTEAMFDVIVAGEVLEHLNNPGLFLKAAFKILRPTGEILITVPNAFFIVNIVALLFHRENTHRDHVFYFSAKTINCLLERYGYEITYLGYTFPMPKSITKKILKFPFYLLFIAIPFFGLQIVVAASKKVTRISVKTNKIEVLK